MLTKLFQYSTVHSNRIESNSINSTIRNRLFLQLFISEMIHAKQWHYSLHRDFQQLHSIHSTRRNPWDSSSTNSTRRQRALRVILHAEGKEIFYPVYKDLQGIPGIPAARPYTGIPGIPAARPYTGIPVLQRHSRHFSHSWHSSPTNISTHSSTFQYTSTFQCYPVYPGIPPIPAFLQSEC